MIDLLHRHRIIAWPHGRSALVATPHGTMRISKPRLGKGLTIDHPRFPRVTIANMPEAIRTVRGFMDSTPCDVCGRPSWLSVRCEAHSLDPVTP